MGKGWGRAYVRFSDADARGMLALYIISVHFLEKDARQNVTQCPCVGLAFGAPQVGDF